MTLDSGSLIERVEYRGEWWLPEAAQRWPGRFVFTPEEGPRLTIDAPESDFSYRRPWEDVPVIHGRNVNGEALTLIDCVQVGAKHHLLGKVEATFAPLYALVGAWCTLAELAFTRLAARLSGFDEWVGVSGFDVEWKKRGYRITYESPHAVVLATGHDTRFSAQFSGPGVVLTWPQLGLDLRQETRFQIEADEPLPLKQLLEFVEQMRNFMSFVARRPIRPLEVVTRADVEVRRGSEVQIQPMRIPVLFKADLEPWPTEEFERRKMLFRPEDHPASRFPFETWLSKRERLKPVIDLYLIGLYQPRIYLELQFISLAQGLESLHSRTFPHFELPKPDHDARMEEILTSTPEPHRVWLKAKLSTSNMASFRQGLSRLIETLPPTLRERIGEVERFTQVVQWTRNYLIHWNPVLEQKAASGQALVRVTEALRLMLESLLLLELDFTQEEIEKLIGENWVIKRDIDFAFESAW